MKRFLQSCLLLSIVISSMTPITLLAHEAETEALEEFYSVYEEITEAESEVDDSGHGKYEQYYDQLAEASISLLKDLSAMSDENLLDIVFYGEETQASIAKKWYAVKDDLGTFVDFKDQIILSNDSDVLIENIVQYELMPDKEVRFFIDYNLRTGESNTVGWFW